MRVGWLLALALLPACSASRPLLDEHTAQPYASWTARGTSAVRSVQHVEAQAAGEALLRLSLVHLASPRPADERLLVLQPGVLADHTTWRFLAPLLAERGDVLLVDPPGTGRSDGPPATAPAPAWSPAWLGAHTLRAVDRWQRARGDRRRLVLVGHSLGSAALVRALTDPATRAELPELCARVDGLVLCTLPDVLLQDDPPALRRVAELSDLEVRAGAALGLLDAELARATRDGVVNPRLRALRQEKERLQGMIAGDRTRHVAQAMLRRFRPVDADGRPDLEAARAIAAREATLDLPVLLIWGTGDDTLSHAMAADVAARLRRVERLDVADARHSVHQERPDVVAWHVAGFLDRHPPPGGAR